MAVTLASLASSAAAAPGGRGCDRPAGSPEEAAVLQYCPRKSPQKRERENRAVAPIGSSGGDGTATPAQGGGPAPDADTSKLPLLGYPASDGVSAIFWILLAILALIAARELYRRYLADRIGSRRASRLPTGGAGEG
jgi:hypothetical protein